MQNRELVGTCHILQGAQLSALMTQRGRMAGGTGDGGGSGRRGCKYIYN